MIRGIAQHGVKRDDQRRAEPLGKAQHVLAAIAAINAVFVLEPDRVVIALVDRARGVFVSFGRAAQDRRADPRIGLRIVGVHQGPDIDRDFGPVAGKLFVSIGGEGRDPAFARRETTDQGKTA